jgi:hypothetical protein
MKRRSLVVAVVIAIVFPLASFQCCLGQTDTNVIAVGGWSEPVSDPDGYTLRARLLVYGKEYFSRLNEWGHARIYLELQHLCPMVGRNPTEIYFWFDDLQFEMRDGLDKLIPYDSVLLGSLVPAPYWVTLPCNSTLRLRADPGLAGDTKPDELSILVLNPTALWVIRPGATNDYYLSATFSPPTNHPSALNYHVWQGTLKLPKVKLPVKKS